jgi:hypothetical protein
MKLDDNYPPLPHPGACIFLPDTWNPFSECTWPPLVNVKSRKQDFVQCEVLGMTSFECPTFGTIIDESPSYGKINFE